MDSVQVFVVRLNFMVLLYCLLDVLGWVVLFNSLLELLCCVLVGVLICFVIYRFAWQ